MTENIVQTSGPTLAAQADGVGDWEEGNERGYSADSEYTDVQARAYSHGYRTGHTVCSCVTYSPDRVRFTMDTLPDEWPDPLGVDIPVPVRVLDPATGHPHGLWR